MSPLGRKYVRRREFAGLFRPRVVRKTLRLNDIDAPVRARSTAEGVVFSTHLLGPLTRCLRAIDIFSAGVIARIGRCLVYRFITSTTKPDHHGHFVISSDRIVMECACAANDRNKCPAPRGRRNRVVVEFISAYAASLLRDMLPPSISSVAWSACSARWRSVGDLAAALWSFGSEI